MEQSYITSQINGYLNSLFCYLGKLNVRLDRLLKVCKIVSSKRFGLSPSSSSRWNDWPTPHKKTVLLRTHGTCAHEVQSKQWWNRKIVVLVSVCVIYALTHSHKELKLMFSPFGGSVPSLKVNFISCCLRLKLPWYPMLPFYHGILLCHEDDLIFVTQLGICVIALLEHHLFKSGIVLICQNQLLESTTNCYQPP